MKNKKVSYFIIGLLLCIVGSAIFITEQYWNGVTSEKIDEALGDLSISLNSSDFKLDSFKGLSNVNTGYYTEENRNSVNLDVVTDDQILQGISVYKNAIEIPSVGIAVQVNEGTDVEALHSGAGHFEDTANIGEFGNFSICGHSSETYRCIFNRLDEVKLFDKVIAYDGSGKEFVYTVTDINIVQSNDWSVINNYNSNEKEMTIMTCCDNGQRRLVVKAKVLTNEEVDALLISRRGTNLDSASNYNSLEDISLLFEYFSSSDKVIYKRYKCIGSDARDRYSIRYGLYNSVLLNNVVLKEHNYPIDYSVDIGFNINE